MSIMLLLECVSCKKRQQIRQGLVQACACGGADFKCVGPAMPASGAVPQLEGWTTFPGVPQMPQPTHVAHIDFDNSAEADRARAAMNALGGLAQSPPLDGLTKSVDVDACVTAAAMSALPPSLYRSQRWLRVERVKQQPLDVGDSYDLEVVLVDSNGPVVGARSINASLDAVHACVLGGREHQRMADEAQRLRDENAKLKVELFDLGARERDAEAEGDGEAMSAPYESIGIERAAHDTTHPWAVFGLLRDRAGAAHFFGWWQEEHQATSVGATIASALGIPFAGEVVLDGTTDDVVIGKGGLG